MSPSEPGLMIRIDLGFKVGGQDTAPAAILLASVRAGLAFSEKPIHVWKTQRWNGRRRGDSATRSPTKHSFPAPILSSNCKPLSQEPRQTRFGNLPLRGRQIIFYAKLLDQIVLRIVNTVRCAPVSITRLAHTAHVDEILFSRLDVNVLNPFPPDAFISNKHHGHMCVSKETNVGALIGKARGRIEVVKNISPLLRRIERSVHDGKIVDTRLQR